MILTSNMISRMRRYSQIDETLEQMLLDQLGTEPYPHTYTAQDIHEQSRKMIVRYKECGITGLNGRKNEITRSDQEASTDKTP